MRSLEHAARLLCAAGAGLLLGGAAHATDLLAINGISLDSSDPTMAQRLNRSTTGNAPGADWSAPEPFPGVNTAPGPFHYDTWNVDLSALEAPYVYGAYIQITFDSVSVNTFLSAYNGSFDPTNLATNYLGDNGNSGNFFGTDPRYFQLVVPTSITNLVLVLNETTSNAGLNQSGNVLIEAFSDTSYTNLTPVPEPATWALLLLGVPLLAGVAKRAGRG
ncbi:MAG: PEP-CTERM sorting domain-containing protein [Proteobacteria bacterium]|nr:PEP-CTERM sorting domain-containing protein [Pseudomonadota bacterium]